MKNETGKQVAKTYNKTISGDLIDDIRSLIETARHNIAITVNTGLTILYWQIGSRIRQDILKEKRAEYEKEIVVTLSRQLSWSHFVGIFRSKTISNVISTPKCAGWNAGVFGHCGKKLMAYFMSEPPYQRSLRNW